MGATYKSLFRRATDFGLKVCALTRLGTFSDTMPQSAKKNSREQGFSMVAVTAFTVVAGCWMLMTAGVALPVYQKAAEFRYWSAVRGSAEAGLDYAVSQLDTAYRAGTTSTYDDLIIDGIAKSTSIPGSVIGSAATVIVTVNNVRAPANASVYNTQLDDLQTGNVVGNTNMWRIVSATSSYAGLSSTVRVVLAPIMITTSSPSGSGSGTTSTVNTPFFQYALFSQNALSTSGNMQSDAYDSRLGAYNAMTNRNGYRGNVGSNTSVSIGGNTSIGGSLEVFSLPKGSTTAVVASRSANASVANQVKVNGITSGLTGTVGSAPSGGDTVLAMEYGTPRAGDYTTPIDKSLSTNQMTLSIAPSAPQGSYNVGAVSVSGNGVVIVRNGAPPVTSINVGSNNTIYIPPGNYKASSMSVSGNGQIRIESGVSTNTIFSMEGSTPGSNVVQISGNGVANSTAVPAKFQIVTNSSKNVQVTGNADFQGVIYAPSANISISGNGNIYGAAVGKSITTSGNGFVHFDLALADTTYAANNSLAYATTTIVTSSGPTNVVNGLQTVSWEEH